MDGPANWRERLLNGCKVLLGLLVLLPLALLYAGWFYLSALALGAFSLVRYLVTGKPPADQPARRPHFLDARSEVPQPTDEQPLP